MLLRNKQLATSSTRKKKKRKTGRSSLKSDLFTVAITYNEKEKEKKVQIYSCVPLTRRGILFD